MNRIPDLVIFLLLLFFTSCNNGNIKKPDVTSNNQFKFNATVTDTINITLNGKLSNWLFEQYLLNDSTLYILDIFNSPKCIYIININKRKITDSICIKKDFMINNRITNIYVHNKDSILCIENYPAHIMLINNKGEIIKNINFKSITKNDSLFSPYLGNEFGINNISYYDSRISNLYVTLIPNGSADFMGDTGFYRQAIFNLKTDSWELFYGKYRGILKKKGERIYFYEMHNPYSLILNKKNYVSYPIDNYIYCYSIDNGILLDSIYFSGKTPLKFPDPLQPNSSDDKLRKLMKKSPFYGPLTYHNSKKLFSRYTFQRNKKSYLYIYDENFKFVTQISLDIDKFYTLIPSNFGFYSIPKINNSSDENILKLFRVELTKIKN